MRGLIAVALLALFAVASAEPRLPPDGIWVHAHKQAQDAPPANQNPKHRPNEAPAGLASVTGERGNADCCKSNEDAPDSGEQGTEFWSPLFGFRLKITDTLIVLFTALLFGATVYLYRATRNLVTGVEKTAEKQLRAYMASKHSKFIGLGDSAGKVAAYKFEMVWSNCGQTPARRANAIWAMTICPAADCDPVIFEVNSPQDRPHRVVGPGMDVTSGTDPVPVAGLVGAKNAKSRIFLFSRIFYETFDKEVSEDFCNEIFIVGDLTKGKIEGHSPPFEFRDFSNYKLIAK
jgi:hypothetical protein